MLLIDDFVRSLYKSYKERNGWTGRVSVIAYGLIMFFGFVPTFFFLVFLVLTNPDLDKMGETDCTISPFVNHGHDELYLWFNVVYIWQSLFQCLFLAAVAVHGYSISSCILLICAPTFNGLFWLTAVKSNIKSYDLAESTMACWTDFGSQIAMFFILTLIALVGAIVDKHWASNEGYEGISNQ